MHEELNSVPGTQVKSWLCVQNQTKQKKLGVGRSIEILAPRRSLDFQPVRPRSQWEVLSENEGGPDEKWQHPESGVHTDRCILAQNTHIDIVS